MITNTYKGNTGDAYLEFAGDITPEQLVYVLTILQFIFGIDSTLKDLEFVDLDFEWIQDNVFYLGVRHHATPDERQLYYFDDSTGECIIDRLN